MDFKHFCFVTVLICSGWALLIAGMTSVEDLGSLNLSESELSIENNFSSAPIADKFGSIIKVLNLALPIGLACNLLLLLTYKTNPIGLFGMSIAIVVFFISSTKTMDAVAIIQANTDLSVDARVWWM